MMPLCIDLHANVMLWRVPNRLPDDPKERFEEFMKWLDWAGTVASEFGYRPEIQLSDKPAPPPELGDLTDAIHKAVEKAGPPPWLKPLGNL